MRKKMIFKRPFLYGLVTLCGASVVTVASCGYKNTDSVNTQNPSESEPEKELNLEEVLNSIEINFAKSKETSTVYEMEQNDLIFTNLDQKKYKISIEKFEKDNEKQEISIAYFIVDNKTQQKSEVKEFVISGFKIEKNQDEIFKQEKKISK